MSLRLFKQEFARGRDIIAKYMPSPKGVVLSFEEEEAKKTADAAAENASTSGDGESAPVASATDSDVAGDTEGKATTNDSKTHASSSAEGGETASEPASEPKSPYDECAERLGAELYAPMCFPAHYKFVGAYEAIAFLNLKPGGQGQSFVQQSVRYIHISHHATHARVLLL